MKKDRTTTLSRAPHPGDNVYSVIPVPEWARGADGDVPTAYNTRLASDINPATGQPWEATFIEVTVRRVIPMPAQDVVYLVVDGADGQGRAIVVADEQDLGEARGWLGRQKVTLAGHRTELFGTVGLNIRRVTR